MQSLSVVIVCKNEADIIGRTLQSLQGITDDVIVFDNGSTDNTIEKAKEYKAQVHQGSWEGFGKTKRKAIALAKYDWILSLDADEAIDEKLKQSIQNFRPVDEKAVYEIRFKNFLGEKWLKYGEWGNDKHIRLFNRKHINWDDAPVHEQLVMPQGTVVNRLDGYVLHRTMRDINDYRTKMRHYALLNAEKYHQLGKKATWIKLYLSPAFSFFNYYILRLGFLDGYAGFICAKMTAWYTSLKYERLKELNRGVASR